MADPRKFPRLANHCQLKYREIERKGIEEKSLQSFMLNLSGGGLCFTTKEEFAPDTLLAIELHAPNFASPIIAVVNTVWCKKRRRDAMYDLGCEFWWVGWKDNDAQQHLSEYIKDSIKECQGEACILDDF